MVANYKHIQVIINPAAGNNEPILNTLNDVFQKYDAHWDVRITHGADDGERLAREAVEAGADLVAAYGGDGTVGTVARGLIGTDVPLAVLPGGTGNSLAVGLRIPIGLAAAAEAIFDSVPRKIDLGEANGERFILRADMGVSTRMTQQASRELKDRFGMLAYVVSAIQALGQPELITFRMMIDGESVETEGIACIVTNLNELGAYSQRLNLNVDPGDGLLDLFILKDVGSAVVAAAQIVQSGDEESANLQHWQGKAITIETDPIQDYSLDGDPLSQTPLEIQVLPQAITVLVPTPAEEA